MKASKIKTIGKIQFVILEKDAQALKSAKDKSPGMKAGFLYQKIFSLGLVQFLASKK